VPPHGARRSAPARWRAPAMHEGSASRQRTRLRVRRRDHPQVRAACAPRVAGSACGRAARRGPRPGEARRRRAVGRADVHFRKGGSMRLFMALLLAVAGQTAHAAYPERPITMIVAYPPGGGPDLIARALAPYVEKNLGGGARIVIVNRAGAGGEVGFAALAAAPADGYT